MTIRDQGLLRGIKAKNGRQSCGAAQGLYFACSLCCGRYAGAVVFLTSPYAVRDVREEKE
jgi:hypothetical protein